MTQNFEAADLLVKMLGPSRIDSPLLPLLAQRDRTFHNADTSPTLAKNVT